jgi:arginyl-tRNA synthetase
MQSYEPHHICTYIYETSQAFNRFYENNKVIGSDRQAIRLMIVRRYTEIIGESLGLLGIHAPESM